jgi:hypothetical protein
MEPNFSLMPNLKFDIRIEIFAYGRNTLIVIRLKSISEAFFLQIIYPIQLYSEEIVLVNILLSNLASLGSTV